MISVCDYGVKLSVLHIGDNQNFVECKCLMFLEGLERKGYRCWALKDE